VIPLFPLLKPHLEAAFEHAEEGTLLIIPNEDRVRAQGPDGLAGANFRTAFEEIIRKTGVESGSRLWHSLRASCESDLAEDFPLGTVAKWLGNTPSVEVRHYVDPTETAFDKASDWTPKSVAQSGARTAQMRHSSFGHRIATTRTLIQKCRKIQANCEMVRVLVI
jgi:integrase